MERPHRIAPALALVLALVLAACGTPEDTADVVGGGGAASTTDGSGTGEPEGSDTDGSDTTEGAAGSELTVDGEASVDGTVEGSVPTAHEVVVPEGVEALITVTPGDDYDIVAEVDGATTDAGLSGEPEIVRATGPGTLTLEVYGYYDDAAGPYTVTVEAA